MDPDTVKLNSVQKMFHYETHSRMIDGLNKEQAITAAKCFLKLYLKQQETLSCLDFKIDLTNFQA